jgi:hypothetical protein
MQIGHVINRAYERVQRLKAVHQPRVQDLKKHDNEKVQRDPKDHRGKRIDVLA